MPSEKKVVFIIQPNVHLYFNMLPGLNSSLAVGFAKNDGSDNAPQLTCIVPGCASTKLACPEKTCTSPTLKDK